MFTVSRFKKLRLALPYFLIVLMIIFWAVDKPDYSIDQKSKAVLIDTIENADGIGNILATRAVDSLVDSELIVMKQTDINFEIRRGFYIMVIIGNVFYFLRREIKINRNVTSAEAMGINTLLLATTGEKVCKIE